MTQNQESQMNVLSVLVSADRKELSKTFGAGLYITDSDTVEQVRAKCGRYIARYKEYIANLNAVLEIPDAKAYRYINSLDEGDKEALKELIGQ